MSPLAEIDALKKACANAIDRCERSKLEELVRELAAKLRRHAAEVVGKLAVADWRSFLTALRNDRAFDELVTIGGILLDQGMTDVKLRKLYAQGLIDSGQVAAAKDVLAGIIAECEQMLAERKKNTPPEARSSVQPDPEHLDAIGILGRAWKQNYIDFACRSPQGPCAEAMRRSVAAYHDAYRRGVKGKRDYPGVNLLAMIMRARRDGIPLEDVPDPSALSEEIIAETSGRKEPDVWAAAAVAEAYVALDRLAPDNPDHLAKAAYWFQRYVSGADRFMLAGTIRNLEEIWGIEAGPGDAGPILLALKLKLVTLDGGSATFTREERARIANARQSEFGTLARAVLDSKKAKTDGGSVSSQAARTPAVGETAPERIMPGHEGFDELMRYFLPIERAKGVARISQGVARTAATGFLVRGNDLSADLGDELFILTNAHAVSRDGSTMPAMSTDSLHPSCVRITFDAEYVLADGDRQYTCEVVWESPPSELDAVLLRIDPKPLPPVTPVSLANEGMLLSYGTDGGAKVTSLVVIGHPQGKNLSASRNQNSKLVDFGCKPPRGDNFLHYRASTEPGSSGSPVLEAERYLVVALHRAGPRTDGGRIACLNGRPEGIEANEGVHIDSIRKAIRAARLGSHAAAPVTGTASPVAKPAVTPVRASATMPATSAVAVVQRARAVVQDGRSLPPRAERPDHRPPQGVRRLTYHELIARLSDTTQRQEDLAPYFRRPGPGLAPYQPVFEIDPDLVEPPMEGAEAYSSLLFLASRYSALRRQSDCRGRVAQGYEGLRFVAEGDSWFDYPLMLDDVIDQLSETHAVFSIASPGDTLANMVSPGNFDAEIDPAIDELAPDGFLLSGGGNDIVGEALARYLVPAVRAGATRRAAREYLSSALDDKLAEMRDQYAGAFNRLLARRPMKIFTHGYDLAPPLPGGTWLGAPFGAAGIDPELGCEIVGQILRHVAGMHYGLAERFKGQVFFVNCIGAVGDRWYDELHPTNEGFARITDRFLEVIETAFKSDCR